MSSQGPKAVLRWCFKVLGSFHLAVAIVLGLLLLTWLGTLDQRFRSIVDVQRDYFESPLVVSRTLGATAEDPQGGFPIPLPGAYLLLSLLFINLLLGGVVRMRKNGSTLGILITHTGIGILLLAGMVEFHFSDKGTMHIDPKGTRDWFESFHDWDLALTAHEAGGDAREWIIPQAQLPKPGEVRTYAIKGLELELVLDGYVRNARPRRVTGAGHGIDGIVLGVLPSRVKDPENDAPGVRATVRTPGGNERASVLLWGASPLRDARLPARVELAGHVLGLDLRRHRWQLPFSLSLDKAFMSYYPGTTMPKEYSSYIQVTDAGASTDVHITMNEPLRHRGFTFYQHQMDTLRTPVHGERFATVFSVVRNPADAWPMWACVILALGLLLHFGKKLTKHIRAESRRQSHAPQSA